VKKYKVEGVYDYTISIHLDDVFSGVIEAESEDDAKEKSALVLLGKSVEKNLKRLEADGMWIDSTDMDNVRVSYVSWRFPKSPIVEEITE
jgi:hypothetical protein